MQIRYLQAMNLIFITAKVFGFIDWSWWLIFTPIFVLIFFESLVAREKKYEENKEKEKTEVERIYGWIKK